MEPCRLLGGGLLSSSNPFTENWGNLRAITKHSHNWDCLKLEEFGLVKGKREKSKRRKARV